MFGQGNYDIAQLKVDMAKIVEEETKVFGVNPNKEYLFIVHNVSNGGGGLEHKTSTTLSVNRDTYDKEHYHDFLNVMAHEYFHLWNVKRLRPSTLGPFDYDRENYTSSLWFSEGFTSYYADVFLRRAGFYTENDFTHTLVSGINYVERTIGNKIQPVADASFDAWIKSYRPNENSRNTTISYYSKGRIIGAVFDAMIIAKFNGEKNLDDFMRMMYELYAVKLKRGFTDKELESGFSKFMEEDLSNFFQQFIYDTKTIDYGKYLGAIGFSLENNGKSTPYFGVSVQEIPGGLWVKTVDAGSPAEIIGLSPNDAIIQVNGALMNLKEWTDFLKGLKKGKTFDLAFVRDGILMKTTATMGENTLPVYEGKVMKDKEKLKLYQVWTKTSVN
jgi:predicted metalloprotease with PDZ domain